MYLTEETSHDPIGWLNAVAPLNLKNERAYVRFYTSASNSHRGAKSSHELHVGTSSGLPRADVDVEALRVIEALKK
jgi:hypothetical protein